MKRHIIFDLDGTLVDSALVCVEILNEMLAERGSPVRIRHDEAKPYLSLGGATMVKALLGPACGNPDQDIIEFRDRYTVRPTPGESVFKGVRDGLAMLHRQGFSLSICSNKPQHLCEKVLRELDLAHLFNVVVGTRRGVSPKPAPDLMDITLDAIGISVEQCIFVGDSDLDHEVALACGIPFYFATYGYAEKDWHAADAIRFDCFSDLVTLLSPPVAAMESETASAQ